MKIPRRVSEIFEVFKMQKRGVTPVRMHARLPTTRPVTHDDNSVGAIDGVIAPAPGAAVAEKNMETFQKQSKS